MENYLQFSTKCADFINLCNEVPKDHSKKYVCYWCSIKAIPKTGNNISDERGNNILITFEGGKELIRGKVLDLGIASVKDVFEDNSLRPYIGIISSKSIGDFLYFVNDTLEGDYYNDTKIGYYLIDISSLQFGQKATLSSNKLYIRKSKEEKNK